MTWLQDCELWMKFGHGKHQRYTPMHYEFIKTGAEYLQGIVIFHSFTGCDTTSSFKGIGKKTAWETWKVFPDVTDVFMKLSNAPCTISEEDYEKLERYTILMYKEYHHCAI